MQIEVLAARVRPTCSFYQRLVLPIVQSLEAGIAVGLQDAAEALQMSARALAFAIRGVAEQNGRWIRTAARLVIADISPQASRFGLASTGSQHRDRRVIRMQLLGAHDIVTQSTQQRFHQSADRADPLGQRRPVELDSFAGIDLALTIQRDMITKL